MAAHNEPEPTDSLRVFGALVKVLRERSGLTQEQFAPEVGYSVPTVASVEQGRRFPQRDFIEKAETVLEADGALRNPAKHLARKPGLATWFREWARLEGMALNLWTYESRVMPGLLQTEGYARAVFESGVPPLGDEQISTQSAARMERKEILRERVNTGFSFVLEESIFLRDTGGTAVTRGLIDHTIECAELRNVVVQIMPLRQPQHAGLDGPMRLLETPDNQWLAYAEGQRGGHLVSDAHEVSVMLQVYATLRSQALTPKDSLSLLERLRGEL